MKSVEPYSRFDAAADKYFSESVKEGVQDNGVSDRLAFLLNDSTPFPWNFKTDFLTNLTNKKKSQWILSSKFP